MQSKLIHLLGGYTKRDCDLLCRINFVNGKFARTIELRTLMKQINGCSKQEWIDIIYNEICPQPENK